MSGRTNTGNKMNPSNVFEGLKKSSTAGESSPKVPVVRTLKPPPEIWELVHTVPTKEFKPGRNFLGRLTSGGSMIVLLLVVAAFVLAYIGLQRTKQIVETRNTQIVAGKAETPKRIDESETQISDTNQTTFKVNAPTAAEVSMPDQPTEPGRSENPRRRPLTRSNKESQALNPSDNGTVDIEANTAPSRASLRSDEKTTTKSLTKDTATNESSSGTLSATRKPNTTLSPKLIDSPKTSTSRKPKVIDWP